VCFHGKRSLGARNPEANSPLRPSGGSARDAAAAELGLGLRRGGNAPPASKQGQYRDARFVTHQLARTQSAQPGRSPRPSSTSRGCCMRGPARAAAVGCRGPQRHADAHAPQRPGRRWAGGPGRQSADAVRCRDHAVGVSGLDAEIEQGSAGDQRDQQLAAGNSGRGTDHHQPLQPSPPGGSAPRPRRQQGGFSKVAAATARTHPAKEHGAAERHQGLPKRMAPAQPVPAPPFSRKACTWRAQRRLSRRRRLGRNRRSRSGSRP